MGLPPKPGGGQPPLPAGPAPNYGGQDAHAAAWAAYYQAQGYNTAGYNAGAAAPAPSAGSPPNPYANYGYGAGASHAQSPGYNASGAGYQQSYGQQQGQSYRPPPVQQPQGNSYNQPNQQGYNNYQGGQGYNSYSPGPQGGQAAGYTPQPNQPYFPQQAQSGSYMSGGGGGGHGGAQGGGGGGGGGNRQNNRPYQPQSRNVSGASNPPRPPSGGFPPAKRPRFDGPGGGGQNGSPQGPSGSSGGLPPRPPQGGRPQQNYSGAARPMSNNRGGGPIPRIGFGGPGGGGRGGGPGGMRGGGGGMRGGGPMRGGMQRQGPRRDNFRQPGPRDHAHGGQGGNKRVDQSPRVDRKRKEKTEAKTTMTDFRIVGIEVKSLDWSWGLIGEHVFEEDEKDEAAVKEEVKEEKPEASAEGEAKADVKEEEKPAESTEPVSETKDEAKEEVKEEVKEEAASESAEPTVGAKRKAKPSSIDGDESSPKKRSSSFVAHQKDKENAAAVSSPESNQNRFRIYFESPPELDRVPKSARRNPNKRWRRESSSVAPSRLGEVEEHDEQAEQHGEGQEQPAEEAAKPDEAAAPTAEKEAATEESTESAPAADAAEADKSDKAADAPAEETAAPAEASTESAAIESKEAVPEPEKKDDETEKPAGEAEAEAEADAEAGDVSMVSAAGGDAEEAAAAKVAEDTAAAVEAALAESAQNAASAYGNRTTTKSRSRRWSTSSLDSHPESVDLHPDVPQPSVNRVSVLYEESSRRLVFDASVVQKIRIFRGEGRIEVDVVSPAEEKKAEVKEEKADAGDSEAKTGEDKPAEAKDELPKGVLVETYDPSEQRFVSVSREKLAELSAASDSTLPPLHSAFSSGSPITLTVYLNKKKPLSEPKWCRTNQADEWLWEQFGRRADSGWRGKLEIMDPDAPPTLAAILDSWKSSSSSGTPQDRGDFTSSLLASPNDLLEILLRLTRGERNPTASIGTGPTSANGPLATAIRSDSPYASHQTHVSLAILAMYRLTTEYAAQAGQSEAMNEKIADIIKSLPTHMIHKSLDGLYKEWLAEKK